MSTTCKRCGQPFQPVWLDDIQLWSTCCETCQCRNMIDGLGLPTPPELLDRHTTKPTLTDGEFRRKLNE